GIDNFGTATVIGSTFTGNSVTTGRIPIGPVGDGGGIINSGGTLTVIDSTFTGNTATIHGGGIDNFSGTATVTGSTFTENTAASGNGGLNNEPRGVLTQSDNLFINDQAPDVFP